MVTSNNPSSRPSMHAYGIWLDLPARTRDKRELTWHSFSYSPHHTPSRPPMACWNRDTTLSILPLFIQVLSSAPRSHPASRPSMASGRHRLTLHWIPCRPMPSSRASEDGSVALLSPASLWPPIPFPNPSVTRLPHKSDIIDQADRSYC